MAEGTKVVGIQLVAENADQFIVQTQAASKAEADLVASTNAAATASDQRQIVTQKEYDALLKAGVNSEYLATQVRVETTEVTANTEAVVQNTVAQDGNAEATKRGATAEISQGEARRAGREIMGFMIAEMAIMQLTAGQTNESMQELGKTLELSLNAGLLAFMATDNLALAGLVALGAGILGVAQMANQANPDIVALNKELDGFSKKDDAIQGLMMLTGITEEDAKAALEAAKNNAALASALDQAAQAAERARDPLNSVKVALGDIAGEAVDLAKQLPGISGSLDLIRVGNDLTLSSDAVKKMNEQLQTTIAIGIQLDQQKKQATADAKEADTQALDLQKLVATDATKMMDLQVADQDKLAKAARNTNEQIARDNRSLQDSLAQISFQRTQVEENNAQQVIQTNRAMNDAIQNAAESRDNAIERADQSLADREKNIQEQLNNRFSDLAYDNAKKRQAVQDEIVKQAQDAADKIIDINRKEQEDLANLGFDTAMQLEKAKTENDKNEISLRAMHERDVIMQRAGDQRGSVEDTLAKQKDASQKKQALDQADYDHQINLAKRAAQQQTEDAQRSYQEQIAQAQKTYVRQVEDAKKRDAVQLANLAIRLKQEEEALNQQADNARKRNAEQIADLRARLAQEVSDTMAAEVKKVEAMFAEIQARIFLLGLITQTAQAEAQNVTVNAAAMRGGGTYVPGMQGQNMGAAEGMDQIISSPTTIQVAEGYRPERVTVQPLSSNSSSSRTNNITVNIQDATDPQRVWEVFRTRLQQEVFRP